jgi:hypothetical protein
MSDIATALEQLDPDDPDFVSGLGAVMQAFAARGDGERSYAAIFRFMERHPDADFGAPGPIVHVLEELGGYEDALAESIRRKPIAHTLWMVNRILNAELPSSERERWLGELRRVVGDPQVPVGVQGEALDFLQHQRRRR